ncbi:MAG: ATP synthase F1 subunit gamma [Clostridia bacterium]|nr:ATP synthase F1 subunit gamma [Clostridia bacterium]
MVRNLSEIRHETQAIEETRQITNAMYLLSTSRMKKAMQKIEYNQIYMRRIRAAVKDILRISGSVNHTYTTRNGKRAAYLIISSDKSMCGAYNFNVVDCAVKNITLQDTTPYISTVGICGTEMLRSKGYEVDMEWLGVSQDPSLYHSRMIAENLISLYNTEEIGEIYVVFTRYINSVTQKAECIKLLPLSQEIFSDVDIEYDYQAQVLYQPSVSDVFNTMVPQYCIGVIYGCLHHACASEHAARMTSMQSATNNADEMINKLKFEYNTARQSAITAEITEIAAAVEIFASDDKNDKTTRNNN